MDQEQIISDNDQEQTPIIEQIQSIQDWEKNQAANLFNNIKTLLDISEMFIRGGITEEPKKLDDFLFEVYNSTRNGYVGHEQIVIKLINIIEEIRIKLKEQVLKRFEEGLRYYDQVIIKLSLENQDLNKRYNTIKQVTQKMIDNKEELEKLQEEVIELKISEQRILKKISVRFKEFVEECNIIIYSNLEVKEEEKKERERPQIILKRTESQKAE